MTKSQIPDSRSDEQLLLLGRDGDEEAFLALYHRYNTSIFRFAFHMSGDREIAEEAVQEVFVALLADRIGFEKDRGTLEAFLIGMARNQVRRQMHRARRVVLAEASKLPLPALPSECVLENRLEALRNAVLSLPESYRAVTVLCDLEELSYSEAAARLGCAVGTVRSRLHRARAILETKLKRSEQCPISTTR